MGPSRRKGGGRSSAAAAAARRKWNIGDLVLAKVKGFPAWPAEVSEPEKWGVSADWKKVFVYFFGTEQIAFCNPVDVEEFTEEKKASLLAKRHGKGADFGRAVKEIIESYEKKRDQITDLNSVDEDTKVDAVGSVGLVGKHNHVVEPMVTADVCNKNCESTEAGDEAGPPAESSVVTTPAGVQRERTSLEGITYSTRKRHRGIEPQSSLSQEGLPSACRSRSSSRTNHRFQKFVSPSNNGGKSSGDSASKGSQDLGVRRSKRIRKSPDLSERHDDDSPIRPSAGSIDLNGSEMVAVDSDTLSLTEGSTLESSSKVVQSETVVQYSEAGVELSKSLDFQTKSVVTKKKRKPLRKRMTTEALDSTDWANGEARSEATTDVLDSTNRASSEARSAATTGVPDSTDRANGEARSAVTTDVLDSTDRVNGEARSAAFEEHNTRTHIPNSHEKVDQKYSKENGDEHLPLVKRARVRMGRPPAGEVLDTFVQSEQKELEPTISFSRQVSTSRNCEDGPADRNSSPMKVATETPFQQFKCPQSSVDRPQQWEVKKIKQFGCSVDGEAALPPSKRLHRALEAMSANAAEDDQTEGAPSMKTSINGCLSPTRGSPEVSMSTGSGNEIVVHNLDAVKIDGTSNQSANSGSAELRENTKSFAEVEVSNGPTRSSSSPVDESGVDAPASVLDKGLSVSSSGVRTTEDVVIDLSPKVLSPNLPEECCTQDTSGRMMTSKDCRSRSSNQNFGNDVNEEGQSKHTGVSAEPAPEEVEDKDPAHITDFHLRGGEGYSSGTELLKHSLEECSDMCKLVKEFKTTEGDNCATKAPASGKIVASIVDGVRSLSGSASFSDDHSGDKDVSGIRSSSCGGLDSSTDVSPPENVACNSSTSKSKSILANNGCYSPVHRVRTKNAGKPSNKAEAAAAAVASFEAALATLTRAKENISCATRIAIDCAKFGSAIKVLDILARKLESEPSLRKRVDMFFLLDSITQCSKGFKAVSGDMRNIYPSALQALLPRLLLAAAPPGSSATENRRQCLKVLKLWLERRILPEPIIRHHIRDLESLSGSYSSRASSRRPMRTERAFDDPIRQMEGMQVDEYGSNSSFQLLGLSMPPMLKDGDGGSDSDGGGFEAVTPEHNSGEHDEQEKVSVPATTGNHRHILEDVDGELEMEDVSPTCEAEMTSTSNASISTEHIMHPRFQGHIPPSYPPPLPQDVPTPPPPLPTSPPPHPPPSSPPGLPPPPMPNPISNGIDSKVHLDRHSINGDMHQPVVQKPVALEINSVTSDVTCYKAPDSQDMQPRMRMADSVGQASISSNLPVSHLHVQQQPVSGGQQRDCATFHSNANAYHLPPPQPAPSNQFSYVHADRSVQPVRELPPPPFTNGPRFVQSTDSRNFYSDHDRIKQAQAPHDLRENWRFSGHSFPGAYHPDPPRGPYPPPGPPPGPPPAPFPGPPCEPPLPDPRWGFPPRAMNHREFVPHRPPSGGSIPVGVRGQGFWRPR